LKGLSDANETPPLAELEALCHSCPDPEEVKTFLKQLGLRLDFQMEAFAPPIYSKLSELPAQFHFVDEFGMSLIYLAGQDSAMEEGERLPAHKSRFWADAGADVQHFEQITHLVALCWSFICYCPAQAEQDAPGGPTLLGLVSAAILGGCVLIVVFYKEYIKEETTAYSLATGDESFARAFGWFVFFVIGLELFSVLFRGILLNFSPVSLVILGVGILGMAVTYVVGKIPHVQMNRPPSVAARYMREEAGRSVFEEGHTLVRGKKLTIAQKRQIASGNPDPIDQVRDTQAAEREREVRAVEERRRIAEEEQARNNEFYQKMIAPVEDSSSNGQRKQPTNFP
jgi:hypothetical protein